LRVSSYAELVTVISFLTVMNKGLALLFRGQNQDFPRMVPSLYRDVWTHWSDPGPPPVPIAGAREYFWDTLTEVEARVFEVLWEEGLPRWRHVKFTRPARWAVIQHYDLWPTPLLDLSTSPRVAATFAFGLDASASRGWLYVVGVRTIRSDLMPLLKAQDSSLEGDAALEGNPTDKEELDAEMLTIRLNAVCPPSTVRPHLQEGVLIGHYPFDPPALTSVDVHDAGSVVVAKIELVNDGGFWSRDFPIHTEASLLPTHEHDPLAARLRTAMRYEWADSCAVALGP
jgi:FRG domain